MMVSAIAALGVAMDIYANCSAGKLPLGYSCCSEDTAPTQYKTTTDQNGVNPAYTYCVGQCGNNCDTCTFQTTATSGCLQSGSYTNCWKWTSGDGSSNVCNSKTCTASTYTYSDQTPTNQGETAKYINDNNDCAGG